MDLTRSDVESILKIIDAAEHLDEVELVHNGLRLHVVRHGSGGVRPSSSGVARADVVRAAPVVEARSLATTLVATAKIAETTGPNGAIAIRAPMLGVFYAAAAPGEKPFIEVGQRVTADDTVCLIEVMKLFNSIRAGVDGEVVRILVENGDLVEFDQPLIFIAPTRA
jgi:acetyl-CoA carboxylase biotin carboxyl carrier protein